MNALETVSDVEILRSLDFEEQKGCEVPPGCDRAARYLIVMSCCGRSVKWCTLHTDQLIAFLSNVRFLDSGGVQCIGCGAPGSKPPRIIPLGVSHGGH